MAELDQIGVVGGVPSTGTGEVPTLAPIRDKLDSILSKIIPAPATAAKQDTIIASLGLVGTRSYDWASIATVAIGSTSAASSAVGADGEYELSADVDCYVLVGPATPEATTSSRFLPAGSPWTVQLFSTDMAAVIRKGEDGTLTILPVL